MGRLIRARSGSAVELEKENIIEREREREIKISVERVDQSFLTRSGHMEKMDEKILIKIIFEKWS